MSRTNESVIIRAYVDSLGQEALRLEAEGSQASADILWDEAHAYWAAAIKMTEIELMKDLQAQAQAMLAEARALPEPRHAIVTDLNGNPTGVLLPVDDECE